MLPSIIVLLNRSGIACASNLSKSVFRLPAADPYAIAFGSNAPVDWGMIVSSYSSFNSNPIGKSFEMTLSGFKSFLSSECRELIPEEKCYFIMMGFGENDIFPSVCKISFKKVDGSIVFSDQDSESISSAHRSYIMKIGDFSSVGTILSGATPATKRSIGQLFDTYHLSPELISSLKQEIKLIDDENRKELELGLGTFNVEGMVMAAETLVNTNTILDSLKAGAPLVLESVREIAVITRPEGLTWMPMGDHINDSE